MKCFFVILTVVLLFFVKKSVCAEIHGKVDLAPIYLNVSIIESGKTTNRLNMGGARFDATVQVIDGWPILFRPNAFFALGDGNIYSGTLGVGVYVPTWWDWLTFIPSNGVTYSHLHTYVDLLVDTPFGSISIPNQKEKFESTSYFLSLDTVIKFNEQNYFTFITQYAWSRTHTTVGNLVYAKGRSDGINIAAVYDYYMTKNWVISAAGAYNKSLSHEKHGIKAFGAKLGISYYF